MLIGKKESESDAQWAKRKWEWCSLGKKVKVMLSGQKENESDAQRAKIKWEWCSLEKENESDADRKLGTFPPIGLTIPPLTITFCHHHTENHIKKILLALKELLYWQTIITNFFPVATAVVRPGEIESCINIWRLAGIRRHQRNIFICSNIFSKSVLLSYFRFFYHFQYEWSCLQKSHCSKSTNFSKYNWFLQHKEKTKIADTYSSCLAILISMQLDNSSTNGIRH